jgi:hypothetical protein
MDESGEESDTLILIRELVLLEANCVWLEVFSGETLTWTSAWRREHIRRFWRDVICRSKRRAKSVTSRDSRQSFDPELPTQANFTNISKLLLLKGISTAGRSAAAFGCCNSKSHLHLPESLSVVEFQEMWPEIKAVLYVPTCCFS